MFENKVGRPTNEILRKRRIFKLIILAIFIIAIIALYFITKSQKEETIKYTILFNSNGGSKVEKQIIEKGQLAIQPKAPEKEEHYFLGWYIGETLYDFSLPVNNNLTLNAAWEKIKEDTVLVTFDSVGGTNIESQIIKKGDRIVLPVSPTKEKSEFLGWYNNDVKFDFNQIINENLVLKAKWKELVTKTTTKKTTKKANDETTKKKETTTKKDVETTTSKKIKISPVNISFVEYRSNGDIRFEYDEYKSINDAVTSISGYEIFRSETQNGNYVAIADSAMTYAYTSGVIDTTKPYYYRVKAYKFTASGKQYGDFGNYIYVPPRVGAPENVSLKGRYNSESTIGTMSITYNTTGADQYILYTGSKDDSSSYVEQKRSTNGSLNSSWKTEGKYYKIVSKKSGSNYVMYSYPNKGYYIPNLAPIKLTATEKNVSNGNNTFTTYTTFNWNSVPNIDRYELGTYSNYNCQGYGYISIDKTLTTYTDKIKSSYARIIARKIGSYYNIESASACVQITSAN